jgi:GNAT superfamily N-acetyltransferase
VIDRLNTKHGDLAIIRAITDQDYRALYEIFQSAVVAGDSYPHYKAFISFDDFADYWLKGKNAIQVMNNEQGELIGAYWLQAKYIARASHIVTAVYLIAEPMRSKGYGRLLVEHSLATAKQLGFDAMLLDLVLDHTPAGALYEKLGFSKIGTVPKAVEQTDAFIYWRAL